MEDHHDLALSMTMAEMSSEITNLRYMVNLLKLENDGLKMELMELKEQEEEENDMESDS